MADLESSWQESVIKLAQTGNLRAIAFWLNRYLVPQGICAQVSHEQPGCLLVRVVCHRPPERERLVRFICHRLCKLNAAGIQEARMTAEIIGSPTLLWEQSARIALNLAQPDQAIASSYLPAVASPSEHLAFVQSLPGQAPLPLPESAAAPKAPARKVAKKTARIPGTSKSAPVRSFGTATPAKLVPAQFLSRLHRTAQLTIHQTVRQFSAVGRAVQMPQGSPIAATHSPNGLSYSSPGFSSMGGGTTLALPKPVKQQIRKSLRWFLAFPPHVRIMLLAGSLSAAFLVGSALHALHRLTVAPPVIQSTEPATFGKRKFSLGASNQVWTALESVPVIRQPVVNPQDPTVTLLFANSAALGRVSQNSAHRLADMVITSLDQLPPLTAASSAASSAAASPATASPIPLDAPLLAASTEPHSLDADPITPDSPKALSIAAMTIADLPANGVDIVNLASAGLTGSGTDLAIAKDLLNKNAVYAIGAGQNQNDIRRPVIVEVKGQRIAYIGYSDLAFAEQPPADAEAATDTGTDAATDAAESSAQPPQKSANVNSPTEAQIAQDIRAVRDQVDWVVVTYQWSADPKSYPEDWQVKLAHLAVEEGADLVVGNRPGISQGGEVYQGRAIAYSLGSSMSGADASPALKVTLLNRTMKLELIPMQLGQPLNNIEIQQKFKQSSSLFDLPLDSPMLLDGKVRLPAAPQTSMPATDPFISNPPDAPEQALPSP